MKALRIGSATLALLAMFAVSASAQGGPEISVEARAGIGLPLSDIGDVIDLGLNFGGGVMVGIGPNNAIKLMAEGDFGIQKGAELVGIQLPDWNILHIMGKVGYDVLAAQGGQASLILNAGGGLMVLSPDGGESASKIAVGGGAKIGYAVTPQVTIFASPQGHIAFTEGSSSLVFPMTAGVRVTFPSGG
jgi:hypothetical protein